jgi:hypothetical protein
LCHTGRARPAANRKVGAGDAALNAKERLIHEKGLVAVLKSLPDQLAAVARILADSPTAQTEAQLATNFTGKGRWKSLLPDIIKTLEALGRARRLDDGRWMG